MSSLVVKVTTIDEIKPHPHADALELGTVGGWQCVVPKGHYQPGDKIVYFPPDTLIPRFWADRFGVIKYLSFAKDEPDKGRIRQAKLRGEPSFGLVVNLPDPDWPVGKDVADYYSAEKYVPPVKVKAGDVETPHPLFVEYTEIENLRNFPDVFFPGEHVIISEKIHGTNCRVGRIEGEFMAGSHRLRRKEPVDWKASTYWFPLTLEPVVRLLNALGSDHAQVVLFGEVYGPGIQNLQYGEKGLAFRAFDLLVDGKYLDWPEFLLTCVRFSVSVVPVLGEASFSLERVRRLASGPTILGGGHLREGVVVKPIRERTDPRMGRVILKYISDEYLFGQKEDFTDV